MIGFDINRRRFEELRLGIDHTNEVSLEELQAAQHLEFTSDSALLAEADVFVVTVPTPIDSAKRPDLKPLERQCRGGPGVEGPCRSGHQQHASGDLREHGVPGATEEVCVPIGARSAFANAAEPGVGFCCGYSPERINPGTPSTGSPRSPR